MIKLFNICHKIFIQCLKVQFYIKYIFIFNDTSSAIYLDDLVRFFYSHDEHNHMASGLFKGNCIFNEMTNWKSITVSCSCKENLMVYVVGYRHVLEVHFLEYLIS